MKKQLTASDVTPELVKSVGDYLLAKARADLLRPMVTDIQKEVLQTSVEIYNDLQVSHSIAERKRITDPDIAYLSEDDEAIDRYYTEMHNILVERNIKPARMKRDYCPLLVAESAQRQKEWDIINAASRMMELGLEDQELNNRLLCCSNGLEKRQQFIDACVGAVVTLCDLEFQPMSIEKARRFLEIAWWEIENN